MAPVSTQAACGSCQASSYYAQASHATICRSTGKVLQGTGKDIAAVQLRQSNHTACHDCINNKWNSQRAEPQTATPQPAACQCIHMHHTPSHTDATRRDSIRNVFQSISSFGNRCSLLAQAALCATHLSPSRENKCRRAAPGTLTTVDRHIAAARRAAATASQHNQHQIWKRVPAYSKTSARPASTCKNASSKPTKGPRRGD